MSSSFVHLHNHSEYSLLDGACKVSDLIARTQELGMDTVALTDHGALFGAIEFYLNARKAGLKPIIGCEVYICPNRHDKTIVNGNRGEYAHHLLLLAKDETGWRNLVKLSSIGYVEGFYYRPRIDHEVLAQHAAGLIATTGCLSSEIPTLLLNGHTDKAWQLACWYRDVFGEDYYVELQNHDLADELRIHGMLAEFAKKLGTRVVATNDTHYLKREYAVAHEALLCIGTATTMADEKRMRFDSQEFYLKSPAEMERRFADFPEALATTLEIAEKCDLKLDLSKRHLPKFPLPEGQVDANNYLAELARSGFAARYADATDALKEQLEYELKVIEQMGFAGYFLITQDFVNYARAIGVAVGPGRGSAAGSLVCYSLGITNIDPVRFELYFERFLNPERITMPDIDIDFQDEGRGRVIEYVKEKYGAESVTQIITFGRLKARAVIRDVGRALGVGYADVDRLAKKIPDRVIEKSDDSGGVKLRDALKESPELQAMLADSQDYRRIWEIGEVLEGITRHASTHAAGVVITPGPLTDYVPLYRQSDGSFTTQFDMNMVDKIGLLKMDFLGLRTLSVIAGATSMLRERGIEIDLEAIIEQHDEKTYQLLAQGDTTAVFQLESRGMREWLTKLKPTCIDDIIAMVALYRPGPMEWIGDFIRRKHGEEKITYLHARLEPILKPTYGVIVYQEQVLRVARDLAGFTLGRADILRRAMGKKDPKELARVKDEFITGCMTHSNIDEKLASRIYDLVFKFAGYGFVKAHATCYGILAYQTAYLKAHFPAELLAAEMSSYHGETRVMPKLLAECRKSGVNFLPPDVNKSVLPFAVENGAIRCGLEAVKNVGEGAIEAILAARTKDGPFQTFYDLAARVDMKQVNKKTLESLIGCGALDSLGGHRAQYMASVDQFFAYALQTGQQRDLGQASLFGGTSSQPHEPTLPKVPPFTPDHQRWLERELLGFFMSSHPVEDVKERIAGLNVVPMEEISELEDGTQVRLAGVVTDLRRTITKKGTAMATLRLEDLTGSAEILFFTDALEKHSARLAKDSLLLISARVSVREEEEPKFIAIDAYTLPEAEAAFARSVLIRFQHNLPDHDTMTALEEIFSRHEGNVDVYFRVSVKGEEKLIRSRRYRLRTSLQVMNEVRQMLGAEVEVR